MTSELRGFDGEPQHRKRMFWHFVGVNGKPIDDLGRLHKMLGPSTRGPSLADREARFRK
jgi:hypothetical protein